MSPLTIGWLSIFALMVLIVSGIHVTTALIVVSLTGMLLLTGSVDLAGTLFATTAFEAIRRYEFAVVPLFIIMGAFMSNSTAAHYLYAGAYLITRKIAGGLAVATVFANALFAAVTGVSVASAAVFSRIALPEMLKQGYNKRLALGSIAGSSVLGMLIPPSLLLILYGVLGRVSIGRLFLAGVLPGILLALLYVVMIVIVGTVRPQWVGRTARTKASVSSNPTTAHPERATEGEGVLPEEEDGAKEASTSNLMLGFIPVVVLMVVVLGGIWLGYFTPTEASGIGAFGALVIAFLYGMRAIGLIQSFRETAVSTGAIMLLLLAAQLYSRMLSRSGVVAWLLGVIQEAQLSPYTVLFLFVVALVVLGAILDAPSILVITVPLMLPAVTALGMDPIWFGIIMVIAIETGLLTPPFGLVPFSMSAVLGKTADVEDIFIGSAPYVAVMLLTLAIIVLIPGLATFLPQLL